MRRTINDVLVITGGKQEPMLNADVPFEELVYSLFKEKVVADPYFGKHLWSALTNTVWSNGRNSVAYSFRAAGDLLAILAGEGTYLDWYCSMPSGIVASEIAIPLALRGWTYLEHNISINHAKDTSHTPRES